MAKATKLPSGNWRVRVYIGKDSTGKAMYRSFTNPDRKKVLFEASLYQIEHREERTRMTFRKAMDEYISSKEMILSPSTVSGYLTIQKMLTLSTLHFVTSNWTSSKQVIFKVARFNQ